MGVADQLGEQATGAKRAQYARLASPQLHVALEGCTQGTPAGVVSSPPPSWHLLLCAAGIAVPCGTLGCDRLSTARSSGACAYAGAFVCAQHPGWGAAFNVHV